MGEEKKPISKSSTVTISLLIAVIVAAISIGMTIQNVRANTIGVKENSDKIENLATKKDLDNLEENLIRYFEK